MLKRKSVLYLFFVTALEQGTEQRTAEETYASKHQIVPVNYNKYACRQQQACYLSINYKHWCVGKWIGLLAIVPINWACYLLGHWLKRTLQCNSSVRSCQPLFTLLAHMGKSRRVDRHNMKIMMCSVPKWIWGNSSAWKLKTWRNTIRWHHDVEDRGLCCVIRLWPRASICNSHFAHVLTPAPRYTLL